MHDWFNFFDAKYIIIVFIPVLNILHIVKV